MSTGNIAITIYVCIMALILLGIIVARRILRRRLQAVDSSLTREAENLFRQLEITEFLTHIDPLEARSLEGLAHIVYRQGRADRGAFENLTLQPEVNSRALRLAVEHQMLSDANKAERGLRRALMGMDDRGLSDPKSQRKLIEQQKKALDEIYSAINEFLES